MMSANISNSKRRAVYKRDGWRCALCDSTKYIQIHHVIPRGKGGNNDKCNLITLCADCHCMAHGTPTRDYPFPLLPTEVQAMVESITQDMVEYLADLYTYDYWPWEEEKNWLKEAPADPP